MSKRSRDSLGESHPEGASKKRKQDGKDGKERKKRLRELKKDIVGLPEEDDVQMEDVAQDGGEEVLSKKAAKKAEKKRRKLEEEKKEAEEVKEEVKEEEKKEKKQKKKDKKVVKEEDEEVKEEDKAEKKQKKKDKKEVKEEEEEAKEEDKAEKKEKKKEKKQKKEVKDEEKVEEKDGEGEKKEKKKKSKKDKKAKAEGGAAEVVNGDSKKEKAQTASAEGDAKNGDAEENGDEEGEGSKKAPRFIVFVGNLPYSATAESIKAHFAPLHPTSVRCLNMKDDPTKCRGCAFVEFSSSKSIRTCLDKWHHSTFEDGVSKARKINVELTAGGGGKTANRMDKIKQKNEKLNVNRQKRIEDEKKVKKAKTETAGEDGIHPSRRAMML